MKFCFFFYSLGIENICQGKIDLKKWEFLYKKTKLSFCYSYYKAYQISKGYVLFLIYYIFVIRIDINCNICRRNLHPFTFDELLRIQALTDLVSSAGKTYCPKYRATFAEAAKSDNCLALIPKFTINDLEIVLELMKKKGYVKSIDAGVIMITVKSSIPIYDGSLSYIEGEWQSNTWLR